MSDREILRSVLDLFPRVGGVEEGEVFVEESAATTIHVEGGSVESLEGRREHGVSVRVFTDRRVGFAYTTELDEAGLCRALRIVVSSLGAKPRVVAGLERLAIDSDGSCSRAIARRSFVVKAEQKTGMSWSFTLSNISAGPPLSSFTFATCDSSRFQSTSVSMRCNMSAASHALMKSLRSLITVASHFLF